MSTIGFIGLGHMGLPMAINLVNAGHHVTGYDLVEEAKSNLVRAGGTAANSLNDVLEQAEVIITMLQTGKQVLHVCGTEGLFQKLKQAHYLLTAQPLMSIARVNSTI